MHLKCGGWLFGVNFDLNDLQAFRAVVELGSFRNAAEALNISRPALSRRIEKFEEALGVRLFERTTRSVTPTTVRRVFAPSAEQLLDDLDVALLGIRDVSTSRLGHVAIACVPSVAYYFLPRVIAAAFGLFNPTSKQTRVELVMQRYRRDRHTRALTVRHRLSFEFFAVSATLPPDRYPFLDSVHVSAYCSRTRYSQAG
jgi:DNA-binding transcriptional LysR family regulator